MKESVDCLQWWSNPVSKDRWPRLSKFAIFVLSFPPMSDEAERVFSGARRTISWDRARLAPDVIEAIECYHHFLKEQSQQQIFSSINLNQILVRATKYYYYYYPSIFAIAKALADQVSNMYFRVLVFLPSLMMARVGKNRIRIAIPRFRD